jgi:hypothetical protein
MPCWPFFCEHHADAAVLAQVRNGLHAAAGVVDPADPVRPRIENVSCPRGDTLTRPSPASAAVATNHIGSAEIQEASFSSIPSKTLPTRRG